jgi:hypothetical protein
MCIITGDEARYKLPAWADGFYDTHKSIVEAFLLYTAR